MALNVVEDEADQASTSTKVDARKSHGFESTKYDATTYNYFVNTAMKESESKSRAATLKPSSISHNVATRKTDNGNGGELDLVNSYSAKRNIIKRPITAFYAKKNA